MAQAVSSAQRRRWEKSKGPAINVASTLHVVQSKILVIFLWTACKWRCARLGAYSLRVSIVGLYQYALTECMERSALFFHALESSDDNGSVSKEGYASAYLR